MLKIIVHILQVFFLFLAGCGSYSLSLTKEEVNREMLASTFVGSPDPRAEPPPEGERILIEWRVPSTCVRGSKIVLDLIYCNFEEKQIEIPIAKRWSYAYYSLVGEEFAKKEGILTYKAKIVNECGEPLAMWTHQLWTELITVP
jgi:hypothetical protein